MNLINRFGAILAIAAREGMIDTHDAELLSNGFAASYPLLIENAEAIQRVTADVCRSRLDEDDRGIGDLSAATRTLSELKAALAENDLLQQAVRVARHISADTAKKLAKFVSVDGHWLTFEYPLEASAAGALIESTSPRNETAEEPVHETPAETVIPETQSHSAAEWSKDAFREGLGNRHVMPTNTTRELYLHGANIYDFATKQDVVIHFARTPGILNPSEDRDWHKAVFFRSLVTTKARQVYYLCNRPTTAAALRNTVATGWDSAVREVTARLEKFLASDRLEILFTDIPDWLYHNDRNVSIVTPANLLVSLRQDTRIASGFSFLKSHAVESLNGVFGVAGPTDPAELLPRLRSEYRCVELERLAHNHRTRPRQIAESLLKQAEEGTLD